MSLERNEHTLLLISVKVRASRILIAVAVVVLGIVDVPSVHESAVAMIHSGLHLSSESSHNYLCDTTHVATTFNDVHTHKIHSL